MAWSGPHQNNNYDPWSFFDPSYATGYGVDHTNGPPFPPPFPPGFDFASFFGGGPPGPHHHPHHPRGGWGGRGRGAWRHHHAHSRGGRRCGGRHDNDQENISNNNINNEEGLREDEAQNPNHAFSEDTPMLSSDEKRDDSETVRDHPDPPESVPQAAGAEGGPQMPPPPYFGHGFGGGWGGFRGRRGGFGMRGGPHHHHHAHPHHHRGGPPPPPPHWGGGWAAAFAPMMAAFAQHPLAQGLRDYIAQAQTAAGGGPQTAGQGAGEEEEPAFAPPMDVFRATERGPYAEGAGWVVHVALPGARKEDVGVHWDADKGVLAVAGVVYRPGDEAFLNGLVSGERRVGLFRREVSLPPLPFGAATAQTGEEAEEAGMSGDGDRIDAEGITAKMEDGVLIVFVPVVEREWTEVRKVDIE